MNSSRVYSAARITKRMQQRTALLRAVGQLRQGHVILAQAQRALIVQRISKCKPV